MPTDRVTKSRFPLRIQQINSCPFVILQLANKEDLQNWPSLVEPREMAANQIAHAYCDAPLSVRTSESRLPNLSS